MSKINEFVTPEIAGVEFNKKELEFIRKSLLRNIRPKAVLLKPELIPPEADSAYEKICRLQEIAVEEGW